PSPRSISTINMLVDDSRFLHAVERDSTGPALLAMLRQWIRTSRHASPYHLMNLAARFQVDDAIPAAREILDIRQLETTSPHLVMTSIMYLSRFGGMETIEDLLELLDDKRSLGRPRRSTSQRENAELQIRDVALLGLLQLTNQSPADYGFENVISSQLLGYSPNSASFANDDARDAAIEKWNRWKRLHLGNIATPIDASEWYPG
ncbi:MAG: hypothetical protein KDA80_16195, partial [Planctomycetaceae bacterium]|nr:hypothetical protein [Planctomycetaceae bacterium]